MSGTFIGTPTQAVPLQNLPVHIVSIVSSHQHYLNVHSLAGALVDARHHTQPSPLDSTDSRKTVSALSHAVTGIRLGTIVYTILAMRAVLGLAATVSNLRKNPSW